MSKELESFYKIKDYGPVGHTVEEYDELVNTVLAGLQRLEAIDNANADEALGDILILAAEMGTSKDIKFSEARFPKMLKDIRNVLLKYQEQKEDIIHYKGTVENLRRDNQLLKEKLARYKAIDDADPNEAMEWLDSEIRLSKNRIESFEGEDIHSIKLRIYEMAKNDLKNQEVIKQYLLTAKEQKEMIVELCEYFGLDNLYPYDDLDDIEHALKNSRDMASHHQLQLLKKLHKQEKESDEYITEDDLNEELGLGLKECKK